MTDTSREEAGYWLALNRAPGVGPRIFMRLLEQFGSPREVFAAGKAIRYIRDLSETTRAYLREPDWSAVERDQAWLEQPDHHLLTIKDAAYPERLQQIASPPSILFVHGAVQVLSSPQLAIVGSRHPSPAGLENAYEFARYLAAAGLTITSGLALGIDGASHRGALASRGITIGVAGTGLDRVYPGRHRDLAHEIAAQGALVSEFPLGTPPRRENFPRRNRVISGLTLGTLVVEATRKSGSLITAQFAAEQGHEVFAIPGSIHNPLARGCHELIRQGAKLVEKTTDILEELAPQFLGFRPPSAPASPPVTDADSQRVLKALGHDLTPIDVIVERSGLTAEVVSSILLMLELEGLVASASAGMYMRVQGS
jgi:DNA processing protein